MNFVTILKAILEAIKAIPVLLDEIKKLNNYRTSKEFEEMRHSLNKITKKIEGAKTHEERRNLARNLNEL